MRLLTAFFQIIRWPNLVFIAGTQFSFYYFIIEPVFSKAGIQSYLQWEILIWIIAASIVIAAAGYIINDYFDLNIDGINKPDKVIIEKVISRRTAILWHLFLSFAGVVISIYISNLVNDPYFLISIAHVICVAVLWVYSTTYKKKLLIGNVFISILTAWTVFILYFIQFFYQPNVTGEYLIYYNQSLAKVFKLNALYTGFAFVISLIREVVKDMEDIEGDAKYGARTMPIVWSISVSKVFTAVWIVVLIGILSVIQFYALQLGWWWSVLYCVCTIIIPLVWILNKLYQAQVAKDYHRISSAVKFVMFAGILSMIFFKIYS